MAESPLINDFENVWKQIKEKYKTELEALSYTQISDEDVIAKQFKTLITNCK